MYFRPLSETERRRTTDEQNALEQSSNNVVIGSFSRLCIMNIHVIYHTN